MFGAVEPVSAPPLLSSENSVLRVLYESVGQCWDAFKVSLWTTRPGRKAKPHLFLCAPEVFGLPARHCAFVPQARIPPALIPCQTKGYCNNVPCLTLFYQEMDKLLPNLLSIHIFIRSLTGSWGQRMTDPAFLDWWERPKMLDQCNMLFCSH